MRTQEWLTEKRLRVHGSLLAVCLWSLFLWNLWTPGLRDRAGNLKGTDFLHFYTLASVALAHNGSVLYDMNAQAILAAERVPQAAGIKYLPLYPPEVSIFFAPLARLSYPWALALWWASNVAIYGACCFFVWRACPGLKEHGATVALLASAYPAFFHLIAWGQTSGLALVCFTVLFFLLRSERDFLAGVVLGCLIFKPQLGLAAAIVFSCAGAWRVLLGAALSSVAQLSVGVLYYGWRPMREWTGLLWHFRSLTALLEPKPYQTHSLRTFWSLLVPWPTAALVLYVATAVVVLCVTVAVWKRGPSLPLSFRYSMVLLASVLVAPHLTVYDLVVLVPAILFLTDWLVSNGDVRSHRMMGTLLYLVYALPLLGPIARTTHIQLSVIAMTWLAYMMWKTRASPAVEGNAEPARPAQI